MATFRQAIERQREAGALPMMGDTSLKNLHRTYGPVAGRSTRGLQSALFARTAQVTPWAVMLCRFKGERPKPALEQPIADLYRAMFRPGSGGLVEYWRDVTLGAIDITGSRVFDWVEVEIPRSQAGGSDVTVPKGPGRVGLCSYGVSALQRRGDDPLGGFKSQIAVYAYSWSKDGVSQQGAWAIWAPFALDGSSNGSIVTLTPPHDGDVTAHEMGHVYGMQHDVSDDLSQHYADPCCIMSQTPTFPHPTLQVPFGPALCLPHLVQRGWMYRHRLFADGGGWQSQAGGISVPLACLDDPGARANLGIALTVTGRGPDWTYHVEYVRPRGWNRGLAGDTVIVRRIATADVGPTPSILGTIPVPPAVGASASVFEKIGNTRFDVTRSDAAGRVVKVTASRP